MILILIPGPVEAFWPIRMHYALLPWTWHGITAHGGGGSLSITHHRQTHTDNTSHTLRDQKNNNNKRKTNTQTTTLLIGQSQWIGSSWAKFEPHLGPWLPDSANQTTLLLEHSCSQLYFEGCVGVCLCVCSSTKSLLWGQKVQSKTAKGHCQNKHFENAFLAITLCVHFAKWYTMPIRVCIKSISWTGEMQYFGKHMSL